MTGDDVPVVGSASTVLWTTDAVQDATHKPTGRLVHAPVALRFCFASSDRKVRYLVTSFPFLCPKIIFFVKLGSVGMAHPERLITQRVPGGSYVSPTITPPHKRLPEDAISAQRSTGSQILILIPHSSRAPSLPQGLRGFIWPLRLSLFVYYTEWDFACPEWGVVGDGRRLGGFRG